MRNISLFVEDQAHQDFLTALTQRLAEAYNVEINIKAYSVRGGHGRVIKELRQYQRNLQRNRENLPDLIIVGTDGNCKKPPEREREINLVISDDFAHFVISAIPDPHIERWLLLDSAAFRTVFGKGCPTPDQKCERDRYKRLLLNAIYEAGIDPSSTDVEYTADLVRAMNLQRIGQADGSMSRLLRALQSRFRIWQQADS